MDFVKQKLSRDKTIALRDNAPVAYTKEKSKAKGNTAEKKVKSEYDNGKGVHGVVTTKQKEKTKNNVTKLDIKCTSTVTQTKVKDDGYCQKKDVSKSFAKSATFSGTPKEKAKQRKKVEKDIEKKRKDIEKERRKILKK